MSILSLSARLIARLNRSNPAARDAELGSRLGGLETFGTIECDYDEAHADAEYAAADIPFNPIVVIELSNADSAANLILPPEEEKFFIIENGSGQTVTVKADGETGVEVTNGSTVMVMSDGSDFFTFAALGEVSAAGEQTLTNKTLTTPIIPSIYQDAGKTKLMTLPNAASDTLVALAATQTLTNKTLAAPAITSPNTVQAVAAHDYGAAHADWTLSASEEKTGVLSVSNADDAVNAIATPTEGRFYTVINGSGQALTVKADGETGIVIANAKAAILMGDGTDFVRITADA
jgi:hypothetical protein